MQRMETTCKPLDLPAEQAKRLGLDFETSLYESMVKSDPDDVDALFSLGDTYTKRGMYREGLEIDKKLVLLLPENEVVHYNLACSYSLLGELDHAMESLEKALGLGYQEFEFMESDPDLASLREDARFEDLLDRYRSNAPDYY